MISILDLLFLMLLLLMITFVVCLAFVVNQISKLTLQLTMFKDDIVLINQHVWELDDKLSSSIKESEK